MLSRRCGSCYFATSFWLLDASEVRGVALERLLNVPQVRVGVEAKLPDELLVVLPDAVVLCTQSKIRLHHGAAEVQRIEPLCAAGTAVGRGGGTHCLRICFKRCKMSDGSAAAMIVRSLPMHTSAVLISDLAAGVESWLFEGDRAVARGPPHIVVDDPRIFRFETLLVPDDHAPYSALDLAHFPAGQVALTPIAVIRLKLGLSVPWPTRRARDNALICLVLADANISHVVIISCAAMNDAARQGSLGGTALANAARSLGKAVLQATCDAFDLTVYDGHDVMLRDVVMTQSASGEVLAVQRYPAVVAQQPPAPDVTLAVTSDSVFVFPDADGGSSVLDVREGVRFRRLVEWESGGSVPEGAVDLTALASSPALAVLPAGARGPSQSHECLVFIALVTEGERSTALVACRQTLYHVAGAAAPAESDLRTSADAYVRALSADAAVAAYPSVPVTLEGDRAADVRFFVFPHQAGRRRGAQSEARVLRTQWTALVGSRLAAALSDGRRRRSSAMPSGASGEEDRAAGGAASSEDAARLAGAVDGTVGAYLYAARSCNARAIVMTAPMYAAARSNGVLRGRDKVRQGAPKDTRLVAPRCGDDADRLEDADAEIPAWDWARSSSALPAARRSRRGDAASPPPQQRTVSSSSVLAYQLGLVAEPTDAEVPYTERQLTHAASVPMAAVVRRARSLFGHDSHLANVVVGKPPPSRGVVQAVSTDVDLFEEHLRGVTTNSEVVRRATGIAALIFRRPDGGGDGGADDGVAALPPRSLATALAG